jgi:hypothetical protein
MFIRRLADACRQTYKEYLTQHYDQTIIISYLMLMVSVMLTNARLELISGATCACQLTTQGIFPKP